jgi:hypothetical protein
VCLAANAYMQAHRSGESKCLAQVCLLLLTVVLCSGALFAVTPLLDHHEINITSVQAAKPQNELLILSPPYTQIAWKQTLDSSMWGTLCCLYCCNWRLHITTACPASRSQFQSYSYALSQNRQFRRLCPTMTTRRMQ